MTGVSDKCGDSGFRSCLTALKIVCEDTCVRGTRDGSSHMTKPRTGSMALSSASRGGVGGGRKEMSGMLCEVVVYENLCTADMGRGDAGVHKYLRFVQLFGRGQRGGIRLLRVCL